MSNRPKEHWVIHGTSPHINGIVNKIQGLARLWPFRRDETISAKVMYQHRKPLLASDRAWKLCGVFPFFPLPFLWLLSFGFYEQDPIVLDCLCFATLARCILRGRAFTQVIWGAKHVVLWKLPPSTGEL